MKIKISKLTEDSSKFTQIKGEKKGLNIKGNFNPVNWVSENKLTKAQEKRFDESWNLSGYGYDPTEDLKEYIADELALERRKLRALVQRSLARP